MALCAIPPESKCEINRHEQRYTAEAAYVHTASLCFPVHLGFSLLLLGLGGFFSPRKYNEIIDQEFCHTQSVMFVGKKISKQSKEQEMQIPDQSDQSLQCSNASVLTSYYVISIQHTYLEPKGLMSVRETSYCLAMFL